MSLKLLSLNFEQLENKIALSALPNSGYRDLGRKAQPIQQIVRQAKKPPLYVPNIPFNAIKPAAINTNESKPVIQNKPLVNTTTIVPIKFVQNVMPDGSTRCQQINQPVNNAPNTVLNQTIQPKQTQVTNITMDKIPEIFFVMRIGKDGVAYCERIEIPNL
jgi:hypothetical protein